MNAERNHRIVRAYFAYYRDRFVALAGEWVDDPEAVVADAEGRFEAMIPDLAYSDDPGHPMAMSLFFTAVSLAMHLALREQGVGTHDFGSALLANLTEHPVPDYDVSEQTDALKAAGDASLEHAKPGEFVFEVGTIALGAHQCDFRYHKGGEPLPLAGQYPDRIQIRR